jgi:hypothetical protein
MRINNLKDSQRVSAAAQACWPTRWWLAYLLSMPVLLLMVGGAAAKVSSLVVPLGDRGMASRFAEAFNASYIYFRGGFPNTTAAVQKES